MKLAWERPEVVRVTLKATELAALVAGARLACNAMSEDDGDQARELWRVLNGFDRAAKTLHAGLTGPADVTGAETAPAR